jgi:malonyl-CoA/methylmalonyl-CoA synthetase
MTASLYELLADRAEARRDAVALDAPGRAWTYAELHALAGRFAGLMTAEGAEPGDRVVVQVDKSVGAVALYLGCLRAGLVFVPLNTAYTPAEVEAFLADCRPRLFFCRPEAEADLAPVAARCGVAGLLALPADAEVDPWAAGKSPAAVPAPAPRGPGDLAAICYTSGTTGRSKGAMLTQENLISNAQTLIEIWGMTADDVLLHALPIYHVHGLFVALHTAFLAGAKVIFLPGFDAVEARARLREASVMMGVPTFYSRLMDEPGFGREDAAHMRLLISGSAPLTAQASDAFFEATGHRILERYGMTEAGMITSNPLDGERIAGTVGFALPDVEVRVCDEAGAELPRGEAGVLEVRGPNVFAGYWEMPEKTAEEMRPDGFFVSGDVAVMDEAGRVSIVGRAKDLIISGGLNIYPKEIEQVLDAVDGVAESAVVGAPHPDMGEGVVAVLVAEADARPSDEALQAALDAGLARFKHPRRFVWVDALPRNAMGKVQKAVLREQVADAYTAGS